MLSQDYTPPDFCDGCGAPHPWASRQARIYELENILEQQDIDEADRLVVADHLRSLRTLEPDEDVERSRQLWKAVQRRAPGRGITVNSIMPGPIDDAGVFIDSIPAGSPFRDQQANGRIGGRIGTPDDVADAAEYLVSDLAAWISGTTIGVTGGRLQ